MARANASSFEPYYMCLALDASSAQGASGNSLTLPTTTLAGGETDAIPLLPSG
jgi:hypothetical protein